MMLLPLILIGLGIWAIIELPKRGNFKQSTAEKQNPLDIARERYARGEITREQYEQLKKDLA